MTHSAKRTLDDFWVPWDDISGEDIDKFRQVLENAAGEADMQLFLEENPRFLCQHLPAARGYWVIPTKRLGSEHITDFMIGEKTPHQPTWHAVELERPQASLFTQRGDPSAALTHAMRQIDDWRTWLSRNRDYASRAAELSGLGLGDIDPELDGLVIAGRGETLTAAVEERRRRLARQNRTRIETYDWLISQAEQRVASPSGEQLFVDWLFHRRDELEHLRAQRAVESVFGNVQSVSVLAGVMRSYDYEYVLIGESIDADDDNTEGREVAYHEVLDHQPGRVVNLELDDWHHWEHSPGMQVVGPDPMSFKASLLVTEIAPTQELQESLTAIADGFWAKEGIYKERPLYTNVLLHLPLDLPFKEKQLRVIAAKELITRRKLEAHEV